MTQYFNITGNHSETIGSYTVDETPEGTRYFLMATATDCYDLAASVGVLIQETCTGKDVFFRGYPTIISEREFDTQTTFYKITARFTVLKEQPVEIQI